MSHGSRPPSCVPTWRGHIETTKDALLVFEACFQGTLHHCSRRPHDRERNQLIVSGNVFIYEEATSGIKRWTDGIPWSPSRILTNFLIYRQLNSPFPPGEKKRATKRSQRPTRPGEPYSTPGSSNTMPTTQTPTTDEHRSFGPESPSTPGLRKDDDSPTKDSNRGLVGSLVDSYEFKENGLLKKTMTVTVHHVQHHLVSYYSLDDAKYNLKTPREDERLKNVHISEALLKQPKFKFSNLDDAGDGSFESLDATQSQYPGYYQPIDHARSYTNAPAHHYHPYSAPIHYPHTGAYAPSHPPIPGHTYGPVPPGASPYVAIAPASHYVPQPQPYSQYYQQPAATSLPAPTPSQQQQSVQPTPASSGVSHHSGPPQPTQQPQHPQYHPGYHQYHHQQQQQAPPPPPPQQHSTPVQTQPSHSTSGKQHESATSLYNYSATAHNEAVGHVYGPTATNGTTTSPQEAAAPAAPAAQAPQTHTWPVSHSYSQSWTPRPEHAGFSTYRTTG